MKGMLIPNAVNLLGSDGTEEHKQTGGAQKKATVWTSGKMTE